MFARSTRHATSPFIRVVNALLLLSWVLSSNGIAPAFTLFAATLDRCHQVKVDHSSSGEVRVVLAHEGTTKDRAHVHSSLTDLMMVFARQTSAQQPDHILAFQSVLDEGCPSDRDVVPSVVSPPDVPVRYVLVQAPSVMRREHIVHLLHAPAWSPGVELKAAKTLMRC